MPQLMLGHLLPLKLSQGELLSLPLRTTTTTKETTAMSKNITKTANDIQVTLRLSVTNPQCQDESPSLLSTNFNCKQCRVQDSSAQLSTIPNTIHSKDLKVLSASNYQPYEGLQPPWSVLKVLGCTISLHQSK